MIQKAIISAYERKAEMQPEEIAVMRILLGSSFPVSQKKIAKNHHWIECSDFLIQPTEGTLRKVRQAVHDLRVKFSVPILSSAKGYWIPATIEEIKHYLERKKKEALAQADSWFRTHKAIQKSVGLDVDQDQALFNFENDPL